MNEETIGNALYCIDNALMELEHMKFEDIPEDLQREFIQAHRLLLHISTVLEMKLEVER